MRRGSYWKMEPALGRKGLSSRRKRTHGVAMEITSGLITALTVLAAQIHPATQRMQFDCTITKVVIKNVPKPGTSVQHEEHPFFWIDDIEKSLVFMDGVQVQITRFDQSWISWRSRWYAVRVRSQRWYFELCRDDIGRNRHYDCIRFGQLR